jgi:hypothetical protein
MTWSSQGKLSLNLYEVELDWCWEDLVLEFSNVA